MTEALVAMDATETRFYAAELYRLKGELLLQQSAENATRAESCFQQAFSIARSQQAKSFELRAAMSLARLWQSQGKRQEVYGLLAPVYEWFTEGFDTVDLQEAKTLLDVLACPVENQKRRGGALADMHAIQQYLPTIVPANHDRHYNLP